MACRVERGRHLTDISPDELQPPQSPEHHLRIPHAQPPRLRRPSAYSVDGIEPIDIEGNIGCTLPDHAACFGDDLSPPHCFIVIHRDEAHPHVSAKRDVLVAVAGAAQPDLDHALGINEPLFDGTPERGAVIDLGPEQGIQGVGMRIEVDTAYGPLGGEGPQDRQG
jgi:hypothetical protein